VRAPSSKTLIVLAALFLSAASVLIPEPRLIPVTGPDGSVMHGADGRVLAHRDMARWNKEIIPEEIILACFVVCIVWLLVRLFRVLYARWNDKKRVV
jgi:hypothetical protein